MSDEEFWFWMNSFELWHVWGYKVVDWEKDCYDVCRVGMKESQTK